MMRMRISGGRSGGFSEIAQTQVGLARQQAMTMMVISRFENHRSVKQLLC